MCASARRRLACLIALAVALLCLAPPAPAATKTWIGGTGQWNTAGNWSPSGQPVAGDDALLTQSDATDRIVTYYNTTNPSDMLNSLKIDATGAGTITLDMPNNHGLKATTEYVGYGGTAAVTQSAGTNNAATLYLGYNSAGNGTYTITGGTLASSGYQYIGYSGTGTLNIQNAAQVSNAVGYLAYSSDSNGTVAVDGSGSTWTNSGDLHVGLGGTGTLSIQNSGQVTNVYGHLGYNSGSCGAASVEGSGSKWTNSASLYIGHSGTGTLLIREGGEVSSKGGWVGYDASGDGTVTVDGSGSKWTNSATLYVGYSGAGALNIKNGGQVSNAGAYLGYHIGSAGTATVDGAGSVWNNLGLLYVGGRSTYPGGPGSVTVQNGGQLTVAGTLRVWETGGLTIQTGGSVTAGTLTYFGTLYVDPLSHLNVTNTLTVGSGSTLTLSGSNVTAGKLLNRGTVQADSLSYLPAGNLELAGGVLSSNGTFSRSLGTGNEQVQWTGSAAMSALGGKLTVVLGGAASPTPLVWGSGNFLPDWSDLVFGSATADSETELRNDIDLGGATQTVTVNDNPAGTGDFATLSGVLSNGGLTKSGTGLLVLKGANTYSGPTTVSDGTLRCGAAGAIGYGGDLTVDGTLDMNGYSQTAKGLSGTGSIVMGAGTLTVGASDGGGSYSGSISGSGRVVKTGAGTQVLAGSNSYSGGTTIQEGVLRASIPASGNLVLAGGFLEGNGTTTFALGLGTGNGQVQWTGLGGLSAYGGKMTVAIGGTASPTPLTWGSGGFVASGSALIFGSPAADSETEFRNAINLGGVERTVTVNDNPARGGDFATLSGVLSNGSIVKTGPGTLSLTGLNTYSGATTISEGAIRATSGTGLPAASNLILSGGVLEGTGTTTFTRSLGTSGSNTVQWTASSGFSAYNGKFTVAMGGAASPTPLTWGAGCFVPSGSPLIFGSATANNETELANDINLAGTTQTIAVNDNPFSGSDLATLSGVLSNGGICVSGSGILVLKGLNTYTGPTIVESGTLRYVAPGTIPSGSDLTVNGTLDIRFSGAALRNLNGSGKVTLGSYTLAVGEGDDSGSFGGVVSGTGGLIKIGQGTQVLSGGNTYSGATTLSAGALRAADGAGLPSGSNLVLAGGTLEGIGATTFTRTLGTTSGKVQWTGGGGFSAYGGKMIVAIGGTTSPTALTWGGIYFVPSGSALVFGSTTADSETEFKNAINLGGATRTITVNDNPATSADFATLTGALTNGGLLKSGNGLLVLTGGNNYSGGTTIAGGTLRANDGAALPTTGNLVLAGGILEAASMVTFTRGLGAGGGQVQWTASGGFSAKGGKFTIAIGGTASPTALTWGSGGFVPSGSALIFGSPTADRETEFRNAINLGGDVRTVTVNDNPAAPGDLASLSGVLSNGSLLKSGSGVLLLKVSPTYTGATTIAEGTLRLMPSTTLASTVIEVDAGATFDVSAVSGYSLAAGRVLKGEGTVLGNITVRGTLAPGSSPGVLSVTGSVTYANGSTLEIEIGGEERGIDYDVVDASGAMTVASGATLSVSLIDDFAPVMGDEFDIMDFSTIAGEFTTYSLPALGDGLVWDTSGLYTDGTIGVTPEPATFAMVVGGLAIAFLRRRPLTLPSPTGGEG